MRRIEDVGSKGMMVRVLCICLCFLPGCCWRLSVAFLMILDEFLKEEEDLAFSEPDFRGLGLRAFIDNVCAVTLVFCFLFFLFLHCLC